MTDPQPPVVYRVFNALRRWSEDRRVDEYALTRQWKAMVKTEAVDGLGDRTGRGRVASAPLVGAGSSRARSTAAHALLPALLVLALARRAVSRLLVSRRRSRLAVVNPARGKVRKVA